MGQDVATMAWPCSVGCNGHQPFRMRIGQRPEHDGIHQAEDGGVGADSESQRGDGGHRNARASSQNPKRMAKVLEHGNHLAHGLPVKRPHLKDILDAIVRLWDACDRYWHRRRPWSHPSARLGEHGRACRTIAYRARQRNFTGSTRMECIRSNHTSAAYGQSPLAGGPL